jgi:hypothetical protein
LANRSRHRPSCVFHWSLRQWRNQILAYVLFVTVRFGCFWWMVCFIFY